MKGTIDQLNFEVILKDEKFTARVQKDIELAKKLNSSLTNILNIRKQINSSYSAAATGAKAEAAAAEKTAKAHMKAKAAMEAAAKSASGSNGLMRGWLRFTATMWSIISVVRIFTKAIGSAIKKISDFQQANANLATIMQVSRKEVRVLTEDALMLGRTTEWTASQVTELQTALAKLGYNIPQIRNMQESVLQFATSVGANLPDAANLAGAALRMFGMHSSEMQKALEILTASTNKTALDFEKLKVALPYAGSIANSIGFDIAQTASLLGVLSNAGLSSSRAGTGLRQILLELSKQNGKLQTAMGGNIKTFDDFVRGLQLMRDRGLEAGEAAKLVSTRASGALLVLANGVDDIKRLNNEVRDTDGLLKTIQAERLDTLHGSTLLLKSAWEGLIQTFRDSAGPMKDVVDWLTKIIRYTSLAASRANRVAQGTDNVTGSDELTDRFKKRYDDMVKSLVGKGMTPAAAASEAEKVVKEEMTKWLKGARGSLADMQKNGYSESVFNRFLMSTPLTAWTVGGKMKKGRAANEQIEAIENAIDSVTAYMSNHAKESAEITANNYLDQWRLIFDTKGEKAARDAADSVIKNFNGDAAMKKRLIDMQAQLDEYINGGGAGGASDRGHVTLADEKMQERERINDLNRDAQQLRKRADAYAKLEPYFGDETQSIMARIFGKGDYSMASIEKQVMDIVTELKKLGNEGSDAADALENAWGLDEASKLEKQAKAAKKAVDDYEKAFSKFDKDWGTGATGVSGKAEKALRDYNNEAKKIEDEYLELKEAGTKANKDEQKSWEDLYKARKKANQAKFSDTINGLADDIFKESMKGFDLSDWNDKTFAQIQAIRNALNSVKVPDAIREMLEKTPEGKTLLDNLDKALNKLVSDMNKNTVNPEWWKKVGKEIRLVAGDFNDVADAAVKYGEAIGKEWGDALETMKEMAETLSVMAERWVKGDWIGVASAGLSFLIKKFIEAATEAKRFELRLAELQEQTRHATLMNAISNLGESVFGTNDLEKLRLGMDGVNDALKRMNELAGKGFYGKVGWSTGNWFLDLLSKINGDGSAGTGTQWFSNFAAALSKYNLPVYDENGILNRDSLDALKELTPEMEAHIQKLIDTIDEYYAALEKVEGVMNELVGNVADEAASKLVDQWIEAGDAALDYADILDDVARSYAKMVLKDMVMQSMPKDLVKDLTAFAVRGDNENFMKALAGAMEGVKNMEPYIQRVLQALEPYFVREDESKAGSVGKGIQSITEDTASLLASYINAIRADVAGIRAQGAAGWENVAVIGAYVPTLNDYLVMIQADTANIAESNAAILDNIQSMMGDGLNGGRALRVAVQ